MAQVLSTGYLDFSKFNWGAGNRLNNFNYNHSEDLVLDGTDLPGLVGTYHATDIVALWAGGSSFDTSTERFVGGGENIVVDMHRTVSSGQLTSFILAEMKANVYHEFFALIGIDVSLATAFKVGRTTSLNDDQALLRTALGGDDRIIGSAAADKVFGAKGNDTLIGKAGNDTLVGDAGADSLSGGEGYDSVFGGGGNDTLQGGKGRDRLNGGLGADTLLGGAGADKFIFAGEGHFSGDKVADFQDGLDFLVFDIDFGSEAPASSVPETVAELMVMARNVTGGVRFNLDGDILTVMGITKTALADQIQII